MFCLLSFVRSFSTSLPPLFMDHYAHPWAGPFARISQYLPLRPHYIAPALRCNPPPPLVAVSHVVAISLYVPLFTPVSVSHPQQYISLSTTAL